MEYCRHPSQCFTSAAEESRRSKLWRYDPEDHGTSRRTPRMFAGSTTLTVRIRHAEVHRPEDALPGRQCHTKDRKPGPPGTSAVPLPVQKPDHKGREPPSLGKAGGAGSVEQQHHDPVGLASPAFPQNLEPIEQQTSDEKRRAGRPVVRILAVIGSVGQFDPRSVRVGPGACPTASTSSDRRQSTPSRHRLLQKAHTLPPGYTTCKP
eukprot:scaffold1708_cov322-Pavlova_lutheri.AAC.2